MFWTLLLACSPSTDEVQVWSGEVRIGEHRFERDPWFEWSGACPEDPEGGRDAAEAQTQRACGVACDLIDPRPPSCLSVCVRSSSPLACRTRGEGADEVEPSNAEGALSLR